MFVRIAALFINVNSSTDREILLLEAVRQASNPTKQIDDMGNLLIGRGLFNSKRIRFAEWHKLQCPELWGIVDKTREELEASVSQYTSGTPQFFKSQHYRYRYITL